jgi:hypothetical protein
MKAPIMVVAAGVLAVGIAVQDFWMPNAGGFGTNLRTYNPDTESWTDVYRIKATPWQD